MLITAVVPRAIQKTMPTMAKLTYALPPMDTITLEISAVHEGGTRKNGHGVPIGVCSIAHSASASLTHQS